MSFIRLYIYILFNARRQPCTIQKSWCQPERMALGYRCKGRIRLISSTSPPDSKILERFHDQGLGNVVLGYSITQPALGLLEGGVVNFLVPQFQWFDHMIQVEFPMQTV